MDKKKKIIVIAVILCLAVVFGLIVGIYIYRSSKSGFEQPDQTGGETTAQVQSDEKPSDIPELKVISTSEEEDRIVVETTYGSFHYPYALSDIIGVKAVDQDSAAQLQFTANIGGNDIVVYTIHYNNEVGVRCGTLKIDDGSDEIGVYVEFGEAPSSLSSDWMATYSAAQETFNDVIFSMSEDDRFVTVD